MNPPPFRNFVTNATVTWPFGTKMKVRILHAGTASQVWQSIGQANLPPEFQELPTCVAVDLEKPDEGYIIAGGDHAVQPVQAHCYLAEFTEGGPLGGYWKILRELTEDDLRPPVNYAPQPLAALRARFARAVDHIHDCVNDMARRTTRASAQPEHVFDFENGVRVAVSIDQENGPPVLHVSGSIRADSEYGRQPPVQTRAAYIHLILEHFNDIDSRPGLRTPQHHQMTPGKGVVHFFFDWNAAEEAQYHAGH